MNVEQDEEMATDDSSSPDNDVMEVVNPSPQRTQPRNGLHYSLIRVVDCDFIEQLVRKVFRN